MHPSTALASALGIAWSSSVSLYATVAFTGLAGRIGWVTLPDGLHVLENPWVIGVALVLTGVEIAASLVPGIATAWEALHAAIRPVAAAGLAVLATWGASPVLVVVAGLLGRGARGRHHGHQAEAPHRHRRLAGAGLERGGHRRGGLHGGRDGLAGLEPSVDRAGRRARGPARPLFLVARAVWRRAAAGRDLDDGDELTPRPSGDHRPYRSTTHRDSRPADRPVSP